jgi:hypothetical protein
LGEGFVSLDNLVTVKTIAKYGDQYKGIY